MDELNTQGLSTRCVRAGGSVDAENGAIRRPIYMNNSYRGESFVAKTNEDGSPVFVYSRDRSANQYYLEKRLASLEGGEDCLVASCGVAACNGTFFTFLSAGDHIVCGNPCYYSVHKFLKEELSLRFGVELTFVDAVDLEAVRAAIRPNTRIVHIESPSNPTTKILDIEGIAMVTRAAGVLLTVDSTWATPILLRPLELGADLVLHSLTKYINGHGDALGGAVIGRRDLIDRIRLSGCIRMGLPISPFNAWLIMRGLSTLPLRMERHGKSAMRIAMHLESHPSVEFVRYPGLESHPQHELAKRQMSGFSGMLNFRLKCSTEDHDAFLRALKLIIPAVSLGHDESLIVHHSLTEADPWYEILKTTTTDVGEGFFRFSVGLEDPEDLIADLEQAMSAIGLRPGRG